MSHPRAQLVARLTVGTAAFGLVAGDVLREGFEAVQTASPYRALWLAVPAAIAVSVVRHRYIARRVHVHDTDLDLLVAIGVALAALGVLTVFSSRLGWAASSLRPEFVLAPLMLFTIASPLFGLRNAIEQVPAFHVIGCAWPFPYVVESSFLPVDALFWLILATLLGAAASAFVRWPARWALPAALAANLAAFAVAALTPSAWLGVPAALAVVIGLRTLLRRPWVWSNGRRTDLDRPSGWPRKRFGIPFVLTVGILAALVPSTGLATLAVASAEPLPVGACLRPPGWELVGHERVGGGPERRAGDWEVGRCEYTTTVDGRGERILVQVSEPMSWVELGAFPTPTLLRPERGVLDPLTTKLRVRGSDAIRYVWHRSDIGGAVVVVSWHNEVADRRWQRIEVIVTSSTPAMPLPTVESRPFKSVMDRVGMVLRTQASTAARYVVVAPEEALANRLARELADFAAR